MDFFLLKQAALLISFSTYLASAQLGLGSKELAEVPTLLTNKVSLAPLHLCFRIFECTVLTPLETSQLLRTHIGVKAATGAMTSFIIARAREEEWGA